MTAPAKYVYTLRVTISGERIIVDNLDSLEAVSKQLRQEIESRFVGADDVGTAVAWVGRRKVAELSYNGRVWPVGHFKDWNPGTHELPRSCECDNAHAQNETVCRFCYAHGVKYKPAKV